jgi:hypothetical protein
MEAAWLGGLPLMRGMTIVAGLIEVLFARAINRIRFLFTTTHGAAPWWLLSSLTRKSAQSSP